MSSNTVSFLLSELFASQKQTSYYVKTPFDNFETASRDDTIKSIVINFDNRKLFNENGMLIIYSETKQAIFITKDINDKYYEYEDIINSFLYNFLGLYNYKRTIIDLNTILKKLIHNQYILSKIYIDPNPKKTKLPSIDLNYSFGFYEYNYHTNPNIVNLYHRFSFKNFDPSELKSELSNFINDFIKLIEIPTDKYIPALDYTYRSNLSKRCFDLNLDEVGYLLKLEQYNKNEENNITNSVEFTKELKIFIELIKSIMELKFKKVFSIKIGKTTLSVNDGMISFSWNPFFKFVKKRYYFNDSSEYEYAVKILKANNQYDLVVNRLREIMVETL